MKPYSTNVVTFRVMLAGYEQACERFHTVTLGRDAGRAFAPLFEALNWAVVLDDQARERWAPEGRVLDWAWRRRIDGGEFVSAIRCVRNRVHHQWADALVLEEGFSLPIVPPLAVHEWRWRKLSDLPAAKIPTNKRAALALAEAEADYERLLAGQPARWVLGELNSPFHSLADLLEPAGISYSEIEP